MAPRDLAGLTYLMSPQYTTSPDNRYVTCFSQTRSTWITHYGRSCKYIQLGARFCLVYAFLFSTCFRQPCAHHQEKLLYLCHTGICHSVSSVVSGLLVWVKLQPADQTPPIHSFSSLSYDRSEASSKASSPHTAIQSFLFQMRVSSPFLKVIQ